MATVTVVAEPGSTFDGDLNRLLALVDLAADCGANYLKTQWCSDPEALARRRNAADYLPHYQVLKYPLAWHETLAARCAERGIGYAVTVYLPYDVEPIDRFVSFYKVSAFEIGATDLFDAIVARALNNDRKLVVSFSFGIDPTVALSKVVSTNVDDEQQARAQLVGSRTVRLHCVSAYPTPLDDLNLATLSTFDGLSDHTAAADPDTIGVGAMAVSAGATWIERHVRLESCRPQNPDYPVSLGHHQFAEYVRRIRLAERARGTAKTYGPTPSEAPMLKHRATSDPTDAKPDGSQRRTRRS